MRERARAREREIPCDSPWPGVTGVETPPGSSLSTLAA